MRLRVVLAEVATVVVVGAIIAGAIARYGAIGTGADASCLSREAAITVIAHKADVEHAGRLSKWRIFEIAERESGLQHCVNGSVKVSSTNDHGVLQVNPAGVWRNCAINRYCNEPWMINDFGAQVDLILNYFDRYHDLCPWNPDPRGNYNPGCGYY